MMLNKFLVTILVIMVLFTEYNPDAHGWYTSSRLKHGEAEIRYDHASDSWYSSVPLYFGGDSVGISGDGSSDLTIDALGLNIVLNSDVIFEHASNRSVMDDILLLNMVFDRNAIILNFINDTGADAGYGCFNFSEYGAVSYGTFKGIRYLDINRDTTQYLYLPNTGTAGENTRFTGSFTIGAMVQFDATADSHLISKENINYAVPSLSKVSYSLYIGASSQIRFRVRDQQQTELTNSFIYVGMDTAPNIVSNNGAWYHIVGVFDETGLDNDGKVHIYLNGEPVDTIVQGNGDFHAVRDVSVNTMVGCTLNSDVPTGKSDCRMTHVFFTPAALDSRQIREHYRFLRQRMDL
ncbi:MAG: hypothetical protein C4541_09205 [Candidatus Auribacter fodinae]|jgi:hypothetical protein|uniref:LamG domain-containing protein n=1 Tax=Candidatus Auribacter fodinae TaxID=2093366 RepID=A0A3A4R513_9BACT|nr:MAG: hypothetical protein C4541_09205 [Candidatus Auribacter fodinae]